MAIAGEAPQSMSAATTTAPVRTGLTASIAIVGGLFFIIGFFTWINGPLITFVKLAFDVSEIASFLVLMVFYLSYFFLALPASWILKRTGMKRGLALSLAVMAVGAMTFGEFATRRWFGGALSGLFVIGAGLTLLQTAVNPYISILGPIESAARRIALMGICNKIAGILAPIVIGSLVLHGIGDLAAQVGAVDAATKAQLLDQFAAKIHAPYLTMAGILLLVAVAVLFSPLPEIRASEVNATPAADGGASQKHSIFQFPHLWLGVLCLFVYVGVEVMAGDAIGTYGHAFGLPLDQTKFFTSFTLAAMLLGYLTRPAADPARGLAGALAERVGAARGAVLGRRTADVRIRFGGFRRRARLRQRDDVAGDLPAGDPWPWPLHRDRLGAADHGDCRWRDRPAGVRGAEAARRLPVGVRRTDGALLPVHPVLCPARPSRRPAGGTPGRTVIAASWAA